MDIQMLAMCGFDFGDQKKLTPEQLSRITKL
jgi:hypothetical protein